MRFEKYVVLVKMKLEMKMKYYLRVIYKNKELVVKNLYGDKMN